MKKIFQMKEQSQKEAGVKDGKELHIRKNALKTASGTNLLIESGWS